MSTVQYTATYPYIGNRPMADVWLEPSNPNSPYYLCLVDTGADYLQLPAGAASQVGLSLLGAPTMKINTVSGSIVLPYLANCDVEIEGFVVTVDVIFDTYSNSNPILGRNALLSIYEAGFNTVEWLSK